MKICFLLLVSLQFWNCIDSYVQCPCQHSSMCQPVTTVYKKELVVFGDGTSDHWKKWNWNNITNIILVSNDNITDLYCFAHSKNVRVTLLVGVDHNQFQQLPEKEFRQEIISSWINKMQQLNLDGLNLDIEGSAFNSDVINGISMLAFETYHSLKSINHNYIVTFDVYYTPYLADCFSFLCYNYTAIANATDYLIVMDYDASLDLLIANSNSPLNLLSRSYNEYIVKLGIPAQHMVMTVPWYGYNYTCSKFYNESGDEVCVIVDMKSSQSCFSSIAKQYRDNAYRLKWWDKAKTPFYTVIINGNYHQFQFDNVESLIYKYQLAQRLGLRGLGLFSADCLDYDSTDPYVQHQTNAMWNAISEYVQKLLELET